MAIVLFATEKLPLDLVSLLVMSALVVSGVLSAEEAIGGFSNAATVTAGATFVLAAALARTGPVEPLGDRLARIACRNFWLAMVGLMIAVGAISAFINNTAAVAVFVPIVLTVARGAGISPSKMLMPGSLRGRGLASDLPARGHAVAEHRTRKQRSRAPALLGVGDHGRGVGAGGRPVGVLSADLGSHLDHVQRPRSRATGANRDRHGGIVRRGLAAVPHVRDLRGVGQLH